MIYSERDADYRMIRKEAQRLSRRHDRSFSLILFAGQNSYKEGGSPHEAVKRMREYCHNKRTIKGHGTG